MAPGFGMRFVAGDDGRGSEMRRCRCRRHFEGIEHKQLRTFTQARLSCRYGNHSCFRPDQLSRSVFDESRHRLKQRLWRLGRLRNRLNAGARGWRTAGKVLRNRRLREKGIDERLPRPWRRSHVGARTRSAIETGSRIAGGCGRTTRGNDQSCAQRQHVRVLQDLAIRLEYLQAAVGCSEVSLRDSAQRIAVNDAMRLGVP